MSDDENDPWSENPFAPENAEYSDENDFAPQTMSSYSTRKPRVKKSNAISKTAKKKEEQTFTEKLKEFFTEEPIAKKPTKKKQSRRKPKKPSKKAPSKKKLASYAKNRTSKDFYKHSPAQRKIK